MVGDGLGWGRVNRVAVNWVAVNWVAACWVELCAAVRREVGLKLTEVRSGLVGMGLVGGWERMEWGRV